MKQPPQWPWLLALLALLALVAARRMHRPEPTYVGRPLSWWLHDEAASALRHRTSDEVLSQAGPDLVPYLIEQLERRDSSAGQSLQSLVGLLPGPLAARFPAPLPAAWTHAAAVEWLDRLGSAASPAVPALIGVLDESPCTDSAAQVLGRIGPAAVAAVPDLIRLATGTNSSFAACRALVQIGGYSSNDVALLSAHPASAVNLTGRVGSHLLAGDTNAAMRLLADTAISPGIRIYAWQLLKDFGPQADGEAPRLVSLLGEPNALAREEGANILASMGPAATPVAFALIESLRQEKEVVPRRAMIHALAVIGPGASNAIPVLKYYLHGDDELTIAAAREALERIRSK
jgi:hypothetical protein